MSAATTSVPTRALALFPPVLLVVGVGGLVVGLIQRLDDVPAPRAAVGTALVAVYLIWTVAEVPITFRRNDSELVDRQTLVPYGSARVATALTACIGGAQWISGWSWWLLVPAVGFAAGIVLRLVAIRVLGRFYSHHVVRQNDHSIVTTGPYRLVRHPAYAGMLLSHLGLVLFFANPLSLLAFAVLTATVVSRIRIEERMLLQIPGYSAFALSRARLLPGVW